MGVDVLQHSAIEVCVCDCVCVGGGRGELQQMEDVALAMGSPAAHRLRLNSKLVNHGLFNDAG